MPYLAWKLIHVVSVILFLGNITTGLFWAAHAHRSRDFRLIASTFDGIMRSDRWFTLPGIVGIVVAGVAAAGHANLPILGTGWILWSSILFILSGIVFVIWVAPLQRRITQLAAAGEATPEGWDAYATLYRRWEWWGALALATPAAALILMILKPALPAL